jgi:hypothetical protein
MRVITASPSESGRSSSSRVPLRNSLLARPNDRASSGSFLLPNRKSTTARTMSSSGTPTSTSSVWRSPAATPHRHRSGGPRPWTVFGPRASVKKTGRDARDRR